MNKTILILITVILFSVINQSYGMPIKMVQLDPANILPVDGVELTIDNIPVNTSVVKQDDVLYLDYSFFANIFKVSPDDISKSINMVGVVRNPATSQETFYLPALKALSIMGLRYTYSPIYSKELLRIRTDNTFKVDPTYKPGETSSQGNIPDPPPVTNTVISTLNLGYPSIVYTVPPGYGYYYPPGYQPGYYFGNYGFVQQGLSVPSIYSNPLPIINF